MGAAAGHAPGAALLAAAAVYLIVHAADACRAPPFTATYNS
jgi:hypothetical protein